jgi:hypothetical protein
LSAAVNEIADEQDNGEMDDHPDRSDESALPVPKII